MAAAPVVDIDMFGVDAIRTAREVDDGLRELAPPAMTRRRKTISPRCSRTATDTLRTRGRLSASAGSSW